MNVGGVATLPKQTTPVFTYLCSEIGETRDVYRFDIDQNDLEIASDLFNMFKGAKAKFKTDDKRCKIVDIESFITVLIGLLIVGGPERKNRSRHRRQY